MKHHSNSSPRHRHRPRAARAGTIHASQGIAPTLANIYFRLTNGTAAQRQAGIDLKNLIISMGREA
jgi:hypothetical protein